MQRPGWLVVLIAACILVSAVQDLVSIAIYGWDFPQYLLRGEAPLFDYPIPTGLVSGMVIIWVAYRSRNWNLAVMGTGLVMDWGLQLDLWASSERLQGRHALMLGYIGISALPILWSEVRTMIKQSRRADNEGS